jgi:hypothetical protein
MPDFSFSTLPTFLSEMFYSFIHVAKLMHFRIKLFVAFLAATRQPSCSRNVEAPHRLATNWTVNYGFVAWVALPLANLLVPDFNHMLGPREP